MNSPLRSRLSLRSSSLFPLTIALATAITTACGSSGTMSRPTSPALSGNTSVTILLSSTANDQLSQYNVGFTSIALTSQSGKTVNLLTASPSTPNFSEFIHVNGPAEPLLTVSVPQDVYTAATATLDEYGGFACVSLLSSGGIQMSFFGRAQSATINLPAPITITGTSMALALNLQVSQSAMFSSCDLTQATFTNTPTFNLAPVAVSSQPTSVANGKENSIDGLIASVSPTGNQFGLTTADGTALSFNIDSTTVYHGVPGFSALAPGMAVDMDAAIQSDGSLLATRVEVDDATVTSTSAVSGPLVQVADSTPVFAVFGREQQGYLFPNLIGGGPYFSFGKAIFQTSSQLTNSQNLPFSASFSSTNMVAGQNVFITSHATTMLGGPTYVPAATVTLVPQTINGTVTGVSTSGGFSTYTVTLASYDLLPSLAVQPGQTTLLSNPGNVVVYVDSNTQMLNATPLAAGSLLRFNGLLFNDNGTLRMDCAQINDGVPE